MTCLTGTPFNTEEVNQLCIEKGLSEDEPLQIEKNLHLLLDSHSRLINHSCNPNCGIRNKNELHALRDIAVNEEITFDYSTTVGGDIAWQMPCACGADTCRKTIGNVLSIPSWQLRAYAEKNGLPDFIIEELFIS